MKVEHNRGGGEGSVIPFTRLPLDLRKSSLDSSKVILKQINSNVETLALV